MMKTTGHYRLLFIAALFSLLGIASSPRAIAAPGDVDSLNANIVGNYVRATAVQPDGKIIIGGIFSSVQGVARNNIARLNADGSLDTTFDPNANSVVYSVTVQADGKVLLGGAFDTLQPNGAASATTRSRIARVNADGSLDTTFDPNANDDVYSVAVQADGKVLLGGDFTTLQPNGAASATPRHYIARLNADGSLDTTFDPNANAAVNSVAVQADGKVLLGGGFLTLQPNGAASPTPRNRIARVNADGSLDTTFDPNANGYVNSVAVQADGKVLLGGFFNTLQPNGAASSTTRNRIARVNADGSLDTTFDPNVSGYVYSVAVHSDGKVLLGGNFSSLQPNGAAAVTTRRQVARVNADGSLDTTFDPKANNSVTSVAVQADGKVLLAGAFTTLQPNGAASATSRNYFARLENDTAIQTLSTPDAATLRWERRGGGPALTGEVTFEQSVDGGANYTPLGSGTRANASANPETWQLSGLSLPATGGILRARGRTAGGDGNGSSGIVQQVEDFGPAGSLATTLNANIVARGGFVTATAVQPDGKIIIGGSFSSVQGVARNNIARLNADGSLDTTFDPKASSAVYSVAVQADGKVLLGGNFTTLQPNGAASATTRSRIARVNADGSLDTTFDPNANDYVESVAVQADGKVLLGGNFTTLQPNGVASATTRNHIARVNADGSLDTAFDPNANSDVYTVAVQADGKVLLGGGFTTLQPSGAASATTRQYIARVNADGSLDTTFDPNVNGAVDSVAVQADGKVLLGGTFTTLQPNGAASPTPRNNIARLNADGSLDTTFDPNVNNTVNGVAVQADGKVLLVGGFTTLQPNGAASATPRNRIARVNADGNLDTTFDPNANRFVFSVAVQADGKVLLGGQFTTLQPNGAASATSRSLFARLNNDAATQSLSAPDTSRVLWSRSGATPEVSQVTFDRSADGGATWTALGNGTRIGTSANWQLTGLSLPGSGYLRARGQAASGSSGLIEQVGPYTASPAITAPAVTTNAATGITTSGATLNASLSSNGAPTDVTFKYSTDSTLTSGVTTTATQTFPGNASDQPVSQALTGLSPHTTYYFRASGTNSADTTDGAILSFTTLNSTPVAASQNVTTDEATSLAITLSATDADGDPLTYAIATQPAHGTVTVSGNTATYKPSGNYNGSDPFTFTASDSFGGTSSPATVSVTVTKVNPTVTTQASSATVVGAVFSDTATLTGALNATGTITFRAFGPNDATCGTTPAFTSTVTVNGNNTYNSGNFIPTAPGTYRFVATYSGDANNNPVANACGDASESVTVGKTNPTISTQASGNITFGGNISDTATLAGGVAASGTVTFKAYGPNDSTCGSAAVFTSTVALTANSANSGNFKPTAVGTYRFVATYSGDGANSSAGGVCNDANESVVVSKANQTITVATSAPSSAAYNTSFTVAATASSGLPVTYSSVGVCTNNGATFTMTSGTGTCTVAYDQAGNSNYNSAPQVTQSVTAVKASQTISFSRLAAKTYGDPDFSVSATASSGLPVSFSATGSCVVSGASVHITGAGSCTVTAAQGGDSNYNAAAPMDQTFNVAKATTSSAVASPVNPSQAGQNVTFTATVSSGVSGLTGSVQFKDNGANLGAAQPLSSTGSASVSTSGLSTGTHAITSEYSGDANFNGSAATLPGGQVVNAAPTPTPTPTVTPTPSPSPLPAQVLNVSTRGNVLTGDSVLIGGFIITGNTPKKVVVRAIGPSTGMATALADPVLDLYEPDGTAVTNDDWQQASTAGEIPSSLQPKDPRESAILITLQPGLYTSVVHGKNNATGIGLVEVYDLSIGAPSKVANISTRGFVQGGDNRLIGGFIVSGGGAGGTLELVVRAIGPSLSDARIANPLADPFLDVRDGNGNALATNNNWRDDANAGKVAQFGLAPKNDLESALYLQLPAGAYTAIVSGNAGSVGVGLVEVYAAGGNFSVQSE